MDIVDFVDFFDEEDMDNYAEMFRDSNTDRVRVNPFEKYTDAKFKKKYRFSKLFARKILDLVKDDLPSDSRGNTIDPAVQVACALRYWARHQVSSIHTKLNYAVWRRKRRIALLIILYLYLLRFAILFQIQDDSGDMHGISQQSVSKIANNVGKALAKKAHLFINMPTTLEDQQETIRGFRSICNFPSVIGAIDCTHIRVKRVGGDMSEAYVNRKGYYSINVQVVCDSNLKIRDIVARWRGSAHDSRVFNESTLKERFERGEFHGRLLGDSGYACTAYLFTPLLNPSNDKEEAYNKAHIRTRNTVERCFGLWKQRFRCLLRGMFMKLSTAKTTIVALAVLHNIAIDMNEDIDIVRYVRHRRRPQTESSTVRGAIMRQRFINQHF